MTIADLIFLYDYTAWANERMFESLETLSDEQSRRVLGGSFPSIRETVAHLVAGEWVWLQRWSGDSPRDWPAWSAGSVAAIGVEWRAIHTRRAEFLKGLRDGELARDLSFTRLNGDASSGPLGHLLQHVVNHSTYHRGQVATMMRQVGAVCQSTDLLWFRK